MATFAIAVDADLGFKPMFVSCFVSNVPAADTLSCVDVFLVGAWFCCLLFPLPLPAL